MIRPATPADAGDVARVHVATWRAAYADLVPAAALDALSVPAGASRWADRLADPATAAWVAEEAGAVAAFACAGPARDPDTPGAGEVYALYVHPAAQRRGLGRDLLTAALDGLGTRTYTVATLWVLGANAPARAFYEACGWTADGSARGIDVGGAVVEEVRYRLPITSSALAR